MSTASDIVAGKYGPTNKALAKFLKVKTRVANDVLNVAWNWHVYGPQGTHPSVAMTKHARRQMECLPEKIHPIIDSLIKEIEETP